MNNYIGFKECPVCQKEVGEPVMIVTNDGFVKEYRYNVICTCGTAFEQVSTYTLDRQNNG